MYILRAEESYRRKKTRVKSRQSQELFIPAEKLSAIINYVSSSSSKYKIRFRIKIERPVKTNETKGTKIRY